MMMLPHCKSENTHTVGLDAIMLSHWKQENSLKGGLETIKESHLIRKSIYRLFLCVQGCKYTPLYIILFSSLK